MRILVAIDSFKGSLSSIAAGNAIRDGILELGRGAEVTVRPMADGGEGTVEALSGGPGGNLRQLTVTGPLGAPVEAGYCILEKDNTAVIEMAAAAGITLIPAEKRDPMVTTTYGVGELIQDAVSRGCRKFVIGIGGSATNDGGTGMLTALGYEFLDEAGKAILPGAQGLRDLRQIKKENVLPELAECTFRVACDVDNPLWGPRGCSYVFGPQKGASPEAVAQMDGWMESYGALAKELFPQADPRAPGAGAAGGLGFAFLAFIGASLGPGVDMVLEQTGMEAAIRQADIVVTGEGRLDSQTVMGKAPIGVARLGKKYGKKVIAFAGCVTKEAEVCNDHGIDAYFPILRQVTTLEEAMDPDNAYENLKATAKQVFRLLL